jgi:hypothetical protein
MANRKTPGFVRDPDQAAELAALLEDTAEELEHQTPTNGLTRRDRARHAQAIARYRRWAAELTAEPEPASDPVQLRPADPFGDRDDTEEATG